MNPTVVSDFCKTALKRLLVSNDTPSPKINPTQLNDALNELNLISDGWNTDGRMIYTQQFYDFALVAGQQTYTIGPSNTANFNTGTQPRPLELEYATFRITNTGGGTFSGATANVAITSDQFTAANGQTVFDLSVTPTNADYVIVTRNGLVETPDMYTINGNVLTLSSGASNGDIIEVREFSATTDIPIGSTGTIGPSIMDLPMHIITDAAEWSSIVSKNITSSIGFYIYMDGAWPLGNINIWPIPSQSAGLELTTWSSLNSAMALTDTISLPSGYARGLSLDLSIAMAPYYGKSADPSVMQMSAVLRNLKKDIGFVNIRSGRMLYSGDASGAGQGGGIYDAISDQKL